MLNYILVGAGGTVGDFSRFLASGPIVRRFGRAFPFGTLFIIVTLAMKSTS
jgi:fluoride ion exporter CrcB/FEX